MRFVTVSGDSQKLITDVIYLFILGKSVGWTYAFFCREWVLVIAQNLMERQCASLELNY